MIFTNLFSQALIRTKRLDKISSEQWDMRNKKKVKNERLQFRKRRGKNELLQSSNKASCCELISINNIVFLNQGMYGLSLTNSTFLSY